jgi:hypothetical protein
MPPGSSIPSFQHSRKPSRMGGYRCVYSRRTAAAPVCRPLKPLLYSDPRGEMRERLNRRDWKSRVRQKRTEGSNPSLSAIRRAPRTLGACSWQATELRTSPTRRTPGMRGGWRPEQMSVANASKGYSSLGAKQRTRRSGPADQLNTCAPVITGGQRSQTQETPGRQGVSIRSPLLERA